MNIQDTAAVLAKAQLVDNRQISELVIREWHDAIGHLNYADAIEAVTNHRRDSTDYLQPAHVVAGARRVREAIDRQARIANLREEIAGNVITLDRAKFEAETQAAIQKHRAERGITT